MVLEHALRLTARMAIAAANCVLAATGCVADRAPSETTSTTEVDVSGASTTTASTALRPTASAAPVSRGPKALVNVPAGESAEPTAAEWAEAPTFNSRPLPSREERCPVAIVREWVRLGCKGGGVYGPLVFAGERGKDFSERLQGGTFYFISRIRRGDLILVRAYIGALDVATRVAWPSDAEGPTIAEAWRAPEGALAVHPDPPQPIPEIPAGPGERPRPGDWVSATPVNTGSRERQPKTCEARVLRDWLQWRCRGNGVRQRAISGFGVTNVDYFPVVDLQNLQGEARLKPGMSASVTLEVGWDTPLTTLTIFWPATEPKPHQISFEVAQR